MDVARLNRMDSLVSGSMRASGDTIAVEINIVSSTDEEIWSRQLTGERADFISLTERAALETARVIAIASDADSLAQMAEIGTTSLAAFEAYSRAEATLDTIKGY